MTAFSFYGPTCDDLDHMAGPFFLPADVKAGDFIEIGMLGAYGCAMRTKFNGFGADETHVVSDEPMASLYTGEVEPERRTATVTRSEEHTSELQSLMRISYAVFCLKNKTNQQHKN